MNQLKRIILSLLSLILTCQVLGQPPINERYSIDDEDYSLFSTVISTDSCYYITGMQGSAPGYNNANSFFGKLNFLGSFEFVQIIENDTLGIAFTQLSKMIQTIDGNFVHLAISDNIGTPFTMLFVKMDHLGDTIVTQYISELNTEDEINFRGPSSVTENIDGTFYGIAVIEKIDVGAGGLLFYRLDINGELISRKYYYADEIEGFDDYTNPSMIQINENRFIIGGSLRKIYEETENKRQHTRILVVDSLGEIIEERIFYEDLLSFDCNGLIQTVDDGYLYCRRLGTYLEDEDVNRYRNSIVKLNNLFDVEWQISLGQQTIMQYLGLEKIKPINDTEFVAVGYYTTTEDHQTGILVKFNIDGEVIWERRYRKIPTMGVELATNRLYDVDISPDGGFVMVGVSINPDIPDELPGQKGWLIKADSEGCLVPGCEDYKVGITENNQEEYSPIYPNPASNSIFYYHNQEHFEPVDIIIYSSTGQVVQQWQISANSMTCEVDISYFENGIYFLTVLSKKGIVLDSQKFVKN